MYFKRRIIRVASHGEITKPWLSERFQIVFSDSSRDIAFTHTSYANEHRLLKISHNERLEFLGRRCSSISYFRAYLYRNTPTDRRRFVQIQDLVVREESLAGLSQDCQFDHFIKTGQGEENLVVGTAIRFLAIYLKPLLGALYWIKEWKSQTSLYLSGHDSKG